MTAHSPTPTSVSASTPGGSDHRTSTPLQRITRLTEITARSLLPAIIASSVTLGAAFALAAVSAWLVTTAWTMPPVLDLTVAVVSVRALGISRGVFRWIDRMVTHDVALDGVVNLRANVFTALAQRPATVLSQLRRGELLARLGDDAQEMADHVIKAVVPLVVAVVLGIAAVVTFAAISPLAAAATVAALVLASVIAPLASYRSAMITQRAVIDSRAEVTAGALGVLDDATSLRIDDRLAEELSRHQARQRAFDDSIDQAALPSALAAAAVPLVMTLACLGSVLAAGGLWLDGSASAGQIGILLLLPLSAFEAATALPDAVAQLARSRAAAARLDAAIGGDARVGGDATVPVATTADVVDESQSGSDATHESLNDSVTVDDAPAHLRASDLAVGYHPDAVRVRDVTLDLPPGSRLAIVGDSGAGKTTLLATLAGLLAPLDGTVQLGEKHLGELPESRVRAQMVMHAEDAHVFHTSVLENLRAARGSTTAAEAEQALAAVGLDEWVAGLPDGLETILGPNGTTISGGERRRLLLARAVVRQAPITLIDEPTEHLDPETGARILTALLDPRDHSLLPAETTVIVVTHQRDAIPASTPVLRLQPGHSAEWEHQ